MKSDIKDFVGVFDEAVSLELCNALIQHYEYLNSLGATMTRQQGENVGKTFKDDKTYFFQEETNPSVIPVNSDMVIGLNGQIREALQHYMQKYDVLFSSNTKLATWSHRLQKTAIGGGYHVWHHERTNLEVANRMLAVIVYLNDVEEGGETEFIYYPRRVKPKQGRIVIWPAGFTHTHRGNPPISNEKYVVTTWLDLS